MSPRTIPSGFYAGPDALARAIGKKWARKAAADQVAADDAVDTAEKSPVPTIVQADDVWRLTVDGAVTEHDTRAEAFAAVEASEWFAGTIARKHDDKWPKLAAGRWVDAASIEDLPAAHDGSQIVDAFIDDMIRNLDAASTAPPVDGGGVSEPHETVYNSDALAAGRVFAGVRVTGADGRPHLWLWVRLDATVDSEVEDQRWAFGSIAFWPDDVDRYSKEPIGARLVSYALTNFPFVDALEPHQPRAERSHTNRAGPWLALTRSRTTSMSKQSAATKSNDKTVRGIAKDKLAELARSLGIAEKDLENYWAFSDAVGALIQGAKIEQVTEGGAAAAPPGDDAAAGKAAPPAEGTVTPARAEDDAGKPDAAAAGADDAANEALLSDVVSALREVFGQPDADPAALLDMLKSSSDAFKGALGGGDPAPNAGEGGQDAAGKSATAIHAELIGMRTQQKADREELSKLRAEVRARAIGDEIDAKFRSAKIAPPAGEDRAELVALCEKSGDEYPRVVALALRGVNRPPQGTVLDADKRTEPAVARDGETDQEAELAAATAEVMRTKPGLSNQEIYSQAYALMRSRTRGKPAVTAA